MADYGHRYTDAQIADIERQLKKEYKQASKEMQDKAKKVLSRFAETDKKMQKKLSNGAITKQEYDTWKRRAVLRNEQVKALTSELTERAVHADEVANEIINNHVPMVYSENFNWATYDIEKQSKIDTNFALISDNAVKKLVTGETKIYPIANVDVPKDKRWNEKHIRSALTQGLLQGESIPKVAKRLQKVTDMDNRAAVRNARTLMGRAQNAGRMDSILRAKELGLNVKKKWVATLDNVTRDSHVDLDGEIVEWDETFSNGLDFPGASGPPEEVYNCRCDVRPYYDKYAIDSSDLSLRNTDKFEYSSYQEWKDAHKVERETTDNAIKKLKKEKEESKSDNESRKINTSKVDNQQIKSRVQNIDVENKKVHEAVENNKPQKTKSTKNALSSEKIAKMSRAKLEKTAYEIAVKLAKSQNITETEALRRAKLLMPAQSIAQLRKYVTKYKKLLL